METWLWLAVFAQFLFAISVLVDKHIVARAAIGKPIVYAFFVSLLSGFVIVLPFFGIVSVPDAKVLSLALVNAAAFTTAIFFLYSGLRISRASDVAPAVGGVSAIATMLFAALVIEGDVTAALFFPILLLAGGTAVISHFHFSKRAFLYTLAAGVSFGFAAFSGKLIFLEVSFFDGFFWPRMMNVIVALSLLLIPQVRSAIFHGGKNSSRGAKSLVLGNKVLGGVAAAMTAFAISMGSVTVVNALGGLQFVFLFIFAFLFARYMPRLKENGAHGGWHTLLGVILIALGLALVYYFHLVV